MIPILSDSWEDRGLSWSQGTGAVPMLLRIECALEGIVLAAVLVAEAKAFKIGWHPCCLP